MKGIDSVKVFVSWSGELSRMVAEKLCYYLRAINQQVEPFMSAQDIAAGARWAPEIAKQLEDSAYGVICMTRENLLQPWLIFEAGSLTRHVEAKACGLLIGDLSPEEVTSPLRQFQHKDISPHGLWDLVKAINECASLPLDNTFLRSTFDTWWPRFQADYDHILEQQSDCEESPTRERDMLVDIVASVRRLEARLL
ncbi:MAG: toll/interleukin-1 receptor domain-containing protein, partial [Planctomycetota bacterium]|nr:toll/interleukin-1 receptor domain-containing protein [Planctomycetota bacterium]